MDHIENKDSHADEARKVLGLPIANAGGILAGLIGSRVAQDRPWSEYPIGTKAHAFMGGHWLRVDAGWKWCNGATFQTPGGDAIGDCIELPSP